MRRLLRDRDRSGLDINCKDGEGMTPLIWASARGYTEIVRLLLGCDEIQVDALCNRGGRAIHQSGKHGYPDITEMLLSKGASVNVQTAPGLPRSGNTPLKLACECLRGESDKTPGSPSRDFTRCVQVLLSHGADVNLATVEGWTPVHAVCRYGNNIDIVNLLLSHGADLTNRIV